MCVVSINVPEEVLLDLHKDENEFLEELKLDDMTLELH